MEDPDYTALAPGKAKNMREVGYLASRAVSFSAGRRAAPRFPVRRIQAWLHIRWGY